MSRLSRPRLGFTLMELVLVVALASLVSAIGLAALHRHLDRLATHAAASEAALALAHARTTALAQHAAVAVHIDTTSGVMRMVLRGERIATHPLARRHGVRIRATRDSLAYDVRGLGVGAANLSILIFRGAAVETVVVSRLGRIRH
jgi:prepilin-type N-terminal cleavage/methylation domain-containing protein